MTSVLGSSGVDAEVGAGATTSDRRVREAVVAGFAWAVSVAGVIWDDLVRWLLNRSVDDPWALADALVGAGFDVSVLNQAMERYNERQVLGALHWIADVSRAQMLLTEVRTSTGRISEIVRALKGYSHMDRATDVAVDVVQGIEDTLVILRSQLSGIDVETRFDPLLPSVVGNGGELNQVWTNLIANAAEALGGRERSS